MIRPRILASIAALAFTWSPLAFTAAPLAFTAAPLGAQVATDLAPGAREEWVVEKLVGFGLIDDRAYAVRPWSRRELSRLLGQARANLDRLGPSDRPRAELLLASIATSDVEADLHWTATGSLTRLESPWLPVTTETGAGLIDADQNPLVRYRSGRDYLEGSTLGVETSLEAGLGSRFGVQVRPRAFTAYDLDNEVVSEVQLLSGQVRAQFGNLRLDLGRSHSTWGSGRDGGTLLTANAPGIDRVRLSGDRPFRLPGFLSVIGPTQAELFFGFLEADRDIPRSRLVGYALSMRPHRLVEVSFSTLIQSGGNGAPEASFWDRVADHVLLWDWIVNGGETLLFSNKGTTVGFRVRVPSLRHTQFFLDFTLEDRAHDLERLFWQDGAWLVGAWVPRLTPGGEVDLRVEYHHSGIQLHRHAQFTSGRTLDRRILGMGGPATDVGFAEVTMHRGRFAVGGALAVENRSNDLLRPILRPDGGTDVWETVEDRPDELYLRLLASLTMYVEGGREVGARFGVERVSDSRFERGAVRYDVLFELEAEFPIRIGSR